MIHDLDKSKLNMKAHNCFSPSILLNFCFFYIADNRIYKEIFIPIQQCVELKSNFHRAL